MPEGFHTFRLECGHVHVHRFQRKTDECAIACTAMVIAMKKGKYVKLDDLRQESQQLGGLSYRPSAKDAGAKTTNPYQSLLSSIIRNGIKERTGYTSYTGTGLGNITSLLDKYGITSTYYNSNNASAKVLETANGGGIAIAGVYWNQGGGHAIVVHGSYNNMYCILDPGTAPQITRSCRVGLPTYSAPYGAVGRFGECISIM